MAPFSSTFICTDFFPCCTLLLCCCFHNDTFCITLYLLEHLSVALSLVLLTDHLPRPQTVSVWEPHGGVLEHFIQGVHSRVQRRHQPLGGAHRSVGSLGTSHRRAGLRSLGSLLLGAVEAPVGTGDPAEDVGGQEGDEGVDPHHEVEEEQQHGVQVLLQLHLGEAVQTEESREERVWRKTSCEKRFPAPAVAVFFFGPLSSFFL